MTSMPDLQSTGRAPAPPAAPVSPPRSETPVVEPVLPVLEPQIETEENRAEARRLTADRYEAEIQQRTAEGLRDAITDTRRRLGPELIEMGRAYEEPPGLNAREEEALAEDRLDAAERVASRTRVAAARLTAMRIAMQENAVRAAESAWTDAQELARINGELTADEPPTDARRTELRARQRQLVDGLVETTGASARENADGSVDLLLGDRALVRGDQAEPLVVTRPATLPTTGGSTTSPAPTAPAETPPTPRGSTTARTLRLPPRSPPFPRRRPGRRSPPSDPWPRRCPGLRRGRRGRRHRSR
ncbi:FlgK family flagellar hook-associated protein [Mobilicoccus caccae]|uniref:Flagellar hook-associated protein FlgK helical domain-containing protein n=1 Tax=Mobilicoccus caccae TaxID=1859295 RepID=A0ABQ6IRX6_9MICO|nr:hypothetical protein [Mobilicoccus caccae]GMA40670.1 hypothetical protein GCM10025883_27150 [Mobilicoccus caccae]